MKNIIDYMKEYGKFSLSEEPFNEVDSVVLCQIGYLNYSKFIPGFEEDKPSVSLKSITERKDFSELFEGYWYEKDNRELIRAVVSSARFGEIKLNKFININNEETDAQFGALTYILPDKSVYICFRGTDISILGWKEDMKLAYSRPVRSQELSIAYLNSIAGTFNGNFRVGGHSKGGNLSIYAVLNAREDVKERVLAIYDHDGPGFRPEIVNAGELKAISPMIHKVIPKLSIVGILLESELDYDVIASSAPGVSQHNTYTWKVKGNAFQRVRNFRGKTKPGDRAINDWILTLSEEEVDIFIDTAYSLLTVNDASNLFDLIEKPKDSVSSAYGILKDLSPKERRVLSGIGRRLISIYGRKTLKGFSLGSENAKRKCEKKSQE